MQSWPSEALARQTGSTAEASSYIASGDRYPHVRSQQELHLWSQPDVDLVVWRRDLPTTLHRWLGRLDNDKLPNGSERLEAEAAIDVIRPLVEACMPRHAMRDLLIADMCRIIGAFQALLTRRSIVISLLNGDAGQLGRFERHSAGLRLLVSYRGPGLEWVSEQHAEAALSAEHVWPVERAPTYAVTLVAPSKGPGQGLVHRVPAVYAPKVGRMLLSLTGLHP